MPGFKATKIVMWRYYMDESTKVKYSMILVRGILTGLILNLKNSKHVIKGGGGSLKGSTTPMIYLGT